MIYLNKLKVRPGMTKLAQNQTWLAKKVKSLTAN